MLLLTEKRLRRGLRQRDVGALLRHFGHHRELAQAEISAIERGRLRPTSEELSALARLFNVSPPERLLQPVVDDEQVVTA